MPSIRRQRKHEPSPTPRSWLKAVPWAALLQAAMLLGERWRSLSSKDRTRLAQLVRESQGRAGKLDARQREELIRLARKLDIMGIGRELLPLVRGAGRSSIARKRR